MKVTLDLPNDIVEELTKTALEHEELTVATQIRQGVRYYQAARAITKGGQEVVVTIAVSGLSRARQYNPIKDFGPETYSGDS
jgi:hypothetical protein